MSDRLGRNYEIALNGRECWIELKNKYQLGTEDALIICPSKNREMYDSALRWLPEYMGKKYIKRAVVIKTEQQENEQRCSFGDKVIFESLEEERVFELLKYYRMIQFTKNIVVISMDMPFGNSHFIGKKGITIDDYVRNALYV